MLPSISDMKAQLLEATYESSLRGLTQNMKWCSELAHSICITDDSFVSSVNQILTNDHVLLAEFDTYSFGKACFESKEFERAAFYLQHCKSQPARFLYFYSRYLEQLKTVRYKFVELLDESGAKEEDNEGLLALRDDLLKQEDQLDAYGFYLLGIVLKRLSQTNEAIENLECAVQMNAMLWCAWQELSHLCNDRQKLKELKLPSHWMSEFFHASTEMELHMNEEALQRYQRLSVDGFGNSSYVKSQIATTLYNLRDFESAVEQFKELEKSDPYLLDNVDTYSNILYIQDERSELSHLVHRLCKVDKYRAETCGVIGNFYSLRGDHEKAVLYFKQSLRLNPDYVGAWTLLGHEYIELKNTSAAIESYRRATEINARDYRAWYGLGQTYELLKMTKYALHYFREAHKLRPNDTRILIALGETFLNIEQTDDAIKCFIKAVRLGDCEGQATIKLAKIYEGMGKASEAVKLYCLYVEKPNSQEQDASHACVYVARFYIREGRYDDASTYARKAAQYTESQEIAKTLQFEISKLAKNVALT